MRVTDFGTCRILTEENENLKEDLTNHPDFAEIASDWYERHNWTIDKDDFAELQEENKKLTEKNDNCFRTPI